MTVTIPTIYLVLPLLVIFMGAWLYFSWIVVNWAFDHFGRWYFRRKGWPDYDECKRQYENR